ncbi:MAG: pantetheine-phosphate adenylyltransferase [Bdellovibrionales bacterium]|nr:pantetheine-phosphate adenylyltransferase [Bdellovibrionales bacterium]
MGQLKRKAIYPGSFDPITNGHVDIIERLVGLYDELTVLIANSSDKTYLFSAEERMHLAKESLKSLPTVSVAMHDGLTVEYAKSIQAPVIIRGLRAVADFEYEMAMANMNKHLNNKIETLIVFADPKFGYVSSRLIKGVAKYTSQLEGLVPLVVLEAIRKKFGQ